MTSQPTRSLRQHRVGAEVVAAVADGPAALRVWRQLVQLAGLERAVGQVVHIGEPAQVAEVGDHGVVDDAVEVEPGEQADPPHPDTRCRRLWWSLDGHLGQGGVSPVPSFDEVVHGRVDVLAGGVQVAVPVEPQVEPGMRVAQLLPPDSGEVLHLLVVAAQVPGEIRVVPEVSEWVHEVGGAQHRRLAGDPRPLLGRRAVELRQPSEAALQSRAAPAPSALRRLTRPKRGPMTANGPRSRGGRSSRMSSPWPDASLG